MERSKRKSERSSKTARRKSRATSSHGSPHRSLVGLNGFLKRAIDIVGSTCGLVLLSPLFAVIATLVKFGDGGSVLYRQVRVGLNGRRFTILKFRTMSEDAEADLGAVWSVPRDPRCTRIGGSLRRYGLDELPQLWNVFRGDMSLVGPRPERPEFTRRFRREHLEYDVRQSVRSGITGYAQIYGWRGDTSLEQRLRHDLFYIRSWSLAMDLRILILTLIHGWSERTRTGI